MKMDKDTLIKQRFWVALCVPLVLFLVGLIWLSFIIPAGIATERKKAEDKFKSAKGAVKDAKNVSAVERAQKFAEIFKSKEDVVWINAYEAQKTISTWPREFEKQYHFQDGLFATEIKVRGKDDKEPDEPEAGKLYGQVVQVTRDFIEVKDKKGRPEKIRATPEVKVDVGDEAKKDDWGAIQRGMNVVATYIKGRYFGDKLTANELTRYTQTYDSQLEELFNILDPIRSDASGVVQFGDNFVQSKEKKYPETSTRYFRYVEKWDPAVIKTEEPWLAQEDLWVQREIFRLIRQANDYVAVFTPELTATEVRILRGAQPSVKTPENDKHVLGRVVNIRSAAGYEMQAALGAAAYGHASSLLAGLAGAPRTSAGQETLVVLGKDGRYYHFHVSPAEAATKVVLDTGKKKVEKKDEKGDADAKDKAPGAADEQPKAEEGAKDGDADKDKEEKAFDGMELFGIRERDEVYVTHSGLGAEAPKDKAVVFTNPYWNVELKLLKQKNAVEVKLTNLLPRPQRLDFNLKVKFNAARRDLTPVEIPGDSLPPAGALDQEGNPADFLVKTLDLPEATNPDGIYEVTQDLSWETAVVRRLDEVNFGSAVAHSHRTFPKQVVEFPAFKAPDAPKVEGADQQAGDPTKGGMKGPGGGEAMGFGARGGRGGMGPYGKGGNAGAADPDHPHGLVGERYADVSKQARRIPVCVVLVADQDHIQRVLASFADSKLRFWTTQVIVNRFPGSLRPNIEVPAEDSNDQSQTGQNKSPPKSGRFGGDREGGMNMGMFYGGKLGRGAGGPPPGMMQMKGGGRGMGSLAPTQGSRPGGGYGGPPGGFGPPGGYGGSSGGLDNGAVGGEDSDRNVELVIYGIVSLYERYPPRPASDSAPPTPKN
jgi:hypothetical protein